MSEKKYSEFQIVKAICNLQVVVGTYTESDVIALFGSKTLLELRKLTEPLSTYELYQLALKRVFNGGDSEHYLKIAIQEMFRGKEASAREHLKNSLLKSVGATHEDFIRASVE